MIRLVVLMTALSATAAAADDPPDTSSLPPPPAIAYDPDHDPTPAEREALEALEAQQLEAAREAGGSHVDTVFGEATAAPEEEEVAEPPATAGTPYGGQAQPDLVIQEPSTVVAPAYGDYGAPAARPGQDLHDLIALLIREWSRPPEIRQLAYSAASAPGETPEAEAPAPAPPSLAAAIRAGRPLYARTLYEVNSDYAGPVIVEILEEPLAGAVATGGFEVVRDRMVLRLTSLDHEGVLTPVDGWAVGLDCACFGIEGEVDRHWFERVILPAAISFAEAWTSALARPDTTVRVDGNVIVESTGEAASDDRIYEGIAAATGDIGRVLTEDSPRAMTVIIPRNTALAVTFSASTAVAGAQEAP